MYTQDLFWKNIPSNSKIISSHQGFLKWNLIKQSFLEALDVPFYIWTGTNSIPKLEEKQFKDKIINKLNKRGLHIYLYEPLCWRIKNSHNRSFYSEFLNTVDLDLLRSDELDSLEKFTKNNKLTNVKIFTCDYQIEKIKNNYPTLNLFCLDVFLRSLKYERNFQEGQNNIKKKFWCGNWRYTIHRHLVASYINNYDCNLSWNLSCNFNKLQNINWFNFDNLNPIILNKIKTGCDFLENNIRSIDHKIPALEIENIEDVYIPNTEAPNRSVDLIKSYHECFCAVVTETRFAQPFGNLSEKTIQAMNSRLPFILVAPPKSLEYLKKLGFKTFDKFWNEDYDLEENHQQRLIKIFKLIDFINEKNIDELKEIYCSMNDILDHNISIIKTLSQNSQIS